MEFLVASFLTPQTVQLESFWRLPSGGALFEEDARHYLMPHFPYAIYDRALSDHLRILAFKHHSRHRDYWRHRLSDGPRTDDEEKED